MYARQQVYSPNDDDRRMQITLIETGFFRRWYEGQA